MKYVVNTLADRHRKPANWLAPGTPGKVRDTLLAITDYVAAPTRMMPMLARRLGVGTLALKDETERFGLGAFKGVGAFYAVALAVLEEVERRTGVRSTADDFGTEELRSVAAGMTLACATAGNHGAAVAAAASLLGCRAVIIVPHDAAPSRVRKIESQGAQVIQLDEDYDACVTECSEQAAVHGWHIISDTSWLGYERVPTNIMQGYSLVADEAAAALDRSPTHIFLQGGVGSFAGAVAAFARVDPRLSSAKIIVVEPDGYACLQASTEQGSAVELSGETTTILSPLACLKPSDLGWQSLEHAADGFLSVSDAPALAAMRALAAPEGSDPRIAAGAAGCAGLAALFAAETNADLRAHLGLDNRSRVLAFITEGRNDDRIC